MYGTLDELLRHTGVFLFQSAFMNYSEVELVPVEFRDLFRPGARFSKAPVTFRARKAIFSYLFLKSREVYRPETLYERNLRSY